MAKKYSKYTSNYILSQEHQRTEKGVINLRDWTTIGEIERLDKGKKPVFGNGNFKFTIRNVASNPTKHITSKFVGTFDYNDVKDALPHNNLTELNLFTNDLRDYAYYGSATELIRGTIQHILQTFPSRIKISNERILNRMVFHYNNKFPSVKEVVDLDFNGVDLFDENIKIPQIESISEDGEYRTIFLLDNPFEIDLHHESILMNEYSNPHRFLTYSFKDFLISDDGVNFEEIVKYTVNIEFNNLDKSLDYTRGRFNCVFDSCQVADITIQTVSNIYVLKGYLFDNKLKWGYDCVVEVKNGYEKRKTQLYIQPKQEIIDKYFNSLEGLEKILLRRDTYPLYLCKIKTPIIQNDTMMMVDRTYQFPNDDGFLDVNSPLFTTYVNNLYDIAAIWDQTYSNNLLQRMTHEAVKNYDWSYKRDVDVSESEEILIGGLRVESLLNVYGRLFDDLKHYIDGIKNAHTLTYDGYNNMPNAHITDELEENGWHIVNTIPVLDVDVNGEKVSQEFSNQTISEDVVDCNNQEILWFNSRNKTQFNWVQNNLNFMKKLKLNTNYIFKSKGTKKSIEMVMGMFGLGDDDFEIKETYYYTKPIEFDTEMEGKFDNLVSSFEGLVTEDTPDGALPVRVKTFEHKLQNGDIEKIDCIVPFLDYNKNIDVDLYFQAKGGWCKYSEDKNKKDYTETMSYLRIKYNISELFTISPNSVKTDDVFYVVDLSDYVSLYNNQSPNSHYFAMTDITNIYNSNGWTNVDPQNTSHSKYNVYINYMENIVATNLGNNPHIGFGRYDIGEYYIENMKNPFKYAIDNCTTVFDEEGIYEDEMKQREDLDLFKFTLTEVSETSESKVFYFKNKNYDNDYYINSKVVKLINKHKENKYFSEYFKEIILPYIQQIIPTTTILQIIGF